jgi:hypothetical protein
VPEGRTISRAAAAPTTPLKRNCNRKHLFIGTAASDFLGTSLAIAAGAWHTILRVISRRRLSTPPTSSFNERTGGNFKGYWAQAAAVALPAPAALLATRARTGGPGDDEDDELRWLMPLLAAVIAIAAVFG